MTREGLPSFSELFRAEIREGLKRGFRRVVPWLAGLCALAGALVGYFAQITFFDSAQWGTAAGVFGGIVTFNGITLALGWTTIGRVYDTVSKAEFSRFLRASGLLNTYLFYITLIHTVEVIGALTAVVGLLSFSLPLPVLVHRIILGCVVATTLYAIRWSAGSARIVKDLSWYYSTFDDLSPADRLKLYEVARRAA